MGYEESMTLVRRIARPMLSSMFISGGISALKSPEAHAERAEPVIDMLQPAVEAAIDPLPFDLDNTQLVQLNGIVQVVGGLMLATGRLPRLSALVLAGSLVPTTLAAHRFWEESDPNARRQQQIQFFKNVSMLGGLMLASVDTEGKPSVAWRARRAARKAGTKVHDINPLTS
jgi:putative oxidoreductase